MKIVIASDSFKGSLTAAEVCEEVKKAGEEIFPNSEIVMVPVADGGEGTLDSLISALHGEYRCLFVHDPLGRKIIAKYGTWDETNAIIEMAQASGLPLVKEHERDIMHANTVGTGELIRDAIEKGCKNIYLGLGGSATNDGGMGCFSALGVKFYDQTGRILESFPANFEKIEKIDISDMKELLQDVKIKILSDVKNPLTGKDGATYMYGKQKGASEADQRILEEGMKHYIHKVEEIMNCQVEKREGAGAAGGIGAGLMAFAAAEMHSGIEEVIEITGLKKYIKEADLVITGEGKMDEQSAYGKVAAGIGAICKEMNTPCIAIVGGMGEGAETMYQYGIDSIMTTVNSIMTIEEAIESAHTLCYNAATRMFRMVKTGLEMCTNSLEK